MTVVEFHDTLRAALVGAPRGRLARRRTPVLWLTVPHVPAPFAQSARASREREDGATEYGYTATQCEDMLNTLATEVAADAGL